MKYIIYILFFVCFGISIKAQVPTGFPSQRWAGWIEPTYVVPDSGTIITKRDTSFIPRFVGTTVTWQRPGIDTTFWFWNGVHWGRVTLAQLDTTSLSNRINLKLNITDTVGKWLSQTSRLVDTVYRVNDSTVGYTIKGQARTFQILGRLPSGGTGTLTSVGLSMPAAFTVSGSPLTGAGGTINVSGAGTSSQYIRGDGTLATMDTTAIPSFFTKVRSQFSATSPITYNSTAGIFGILNANTSGQKGAATFTNSDFTDNGLGLIGLSDLSDGSCLNCQLTISKGRISSFADGSIFLLSNAPGAGDTLVVSGDTIKRIYAGYGLISTPTASSIALRVDTTLIQKLITANNGLTKTGNNIQLGGTLVQSTPITVGTNDLSIVAANGTTSTTRFTIDNTNTVISGRYEDFSSINTIYTNQDNIQIVSTQPTGARRILIDSTTGITIGENVSGVYKGIIFKKGTSQLQANGYTGSTFQTIDTSFNSLVVDGSGNIFKRAGDGLPPQIDWCNIVLAGADSTGNIDASPIIQSLVNAGCRVIYGPHGNYKLNSTIQMKDSITVMGDGKSTVFHLTQNQPGFRSGQTTGQWNTFRDFTISGSYVIDSTQQEGIRADTVKGLLIFNVYFFKTAGPAIHFKKNVSSTEANTVLGCYFDSCRKAIWAESEFNKITSNTIAYCDTGLKVGFGNNVVNDNNITKGSIGVYLYGHSAGGEANDGHTEMTANIIAHNFNTGLFVDGITNGEQFGHNEIRENAVYDIYAQNSDNLWFDNDDVGTDSLVFVNCTNTNISSTVKFWSATTGRPGPPDQFPRWRIVGDTPTIAGSGWYKNTFSLYDVIDNKILNIKHVNNVVDFTTTNIGKLRTTDTVETPVIIGSEVYNGSLNLFGSSNRTIANAGNIFFGNNFVMRDSVSTNKEPMLGVGQLTFRGYFIDLQLKRRGIAWIHSENDSSSTLSGAGIRLNNAQGHRTDVYTTDNLFANAANDATIIYSGSTANGLKLVADSGPVEIGSSQAINTSIYQRWFLTGNTAINSLTDNGHKFQLNGEMTMHKDSVPIVTSITTQYLLLLDTAGGANSPYERITPSAAGLGNIYTTDGRFTTNRTVSGANNNLKFDSIGNFQINADTYIFEKKNATIPYTAAILGSGNVFELGYTPTPTVFSKGAGIIIDTNNNASLGTTQIPSTAPLYVTGGSTYVSGFQNQGGTFLPVATITTGTTSVALTYYFIQCDASGGNITLNLPAASTAFAGSIGIKYVFYRTDNTGNTVTVNAAGGDSINGTGSFTLVGQYTTKQLQCVSTSAWAQY